MSSIPSRINRTGSRPDLLKASQLASYVYQLKSEPTIHQSVLVPRGVLRQSLGGPITNTLSTIKNIIILLST